MTPAPTAPGEAPGPVGSAPGGPSPLQLTCILLTWNSAAYVEPCLRSVFADLASSDFTHEVIVVDNGSTDGTLGLLRALARPALTVVPLGHNTGTTFSRNIGLRMSRGRFVAILDSDIEIRQAGSFAGLLHYLQGHPDTGIVAPQLRFPSGRYQKTVDVFPTLTHKLRRFLHLRAMEQAEGSLATGSEPQDVDYAVSAFWMLPHSLTQRIGLLDERIFYAPEDVDYCLRAALAGYRVVYVPGIVATHHAQEISRRKLWSKSFREHVKGLAYFWRKHEFLFGLGDIRAQIAAAARVRVSD